MKPVRPRGSRAPRRARAESCCGAPLLAALFALGGWAFASDARTREAPYELPADTGGRAEVERSTQRQYETSGPFQQVHRGFHGSHVRAESAPVPNGDGAGIRAGPRIASAME